MAKVLVIAEKKTVAQAIAEAFGTRAASSLHWEDESRLVTFTNGHAVCNLEMAEYSPSLRKWSLAGLPFIPEGFLTKVDEEHRDIVRAICSFYCREDVTSVVCATDPEREGELIFREVMQEARAAYLAANGHEKEGVCVYRLWVSSMEKDAILRGFSELRPDSEYDGLYDAALARNHADWIVGMNMTRYYTSLYGNADIKYNVGRLISPIVNMVVRRKAECDAFVKHTSFHIEKTSSGLVFRSPDFAKKEEAEAAAKALSFSALHLTEVRKKSVSIRSPRLLCLNSLQMIANSQYGLTASETLDLAQELYEKRLLSYPRTDSEFIEEKSASSFAGIMAALAPVFGADMKICDVSKTVDDSRVSGHPALHLTHFGAVRYCMMKTEKDASENEGLSERHMKIMDIVARRMACAVSPDASAVELTVSAVSGKVDFTAHKTCFRSLGFLSLAGNKGRFSVEEVPHITSATTLPYGVTEVRSSVGNVPVPYTDGTLLKAMTEAGNDVLDPELVRKGLGGIGTSATRAEAIERVIESGYIRRVDEYGDGAPSHLEPTGEGVKLVKFADRKLLDERTTAAWETRLSKVSTGELSYFAFMDKIASYVTKILSQDRRISGTVEVGPCPVCGKPMADLGTGAWCPDQTCGTVFYRSMKMPRHEFSAKEMAAVLSGKGIRVLYVPPSGGKGWEKIYVLDKEATEKAKAVRLKEVKKNEQ